MNKCLSYSITFIFVVFCIIASIFTYNTLNVIDYQHSFKDLKEDEFFKQLTDSMKEDMATRFSRSIRFKTVSHQDPSLDDVDELKALHDYLEISFPNVHSKLKREKINGLSLLYTWKGETDESFMLIGHMDVVAVEPETLSNWTHPPFEGRIADGYIWGRGAMDDRIQIFGVLESIENLLIQGYKPKHTILLGFGHDEEVGGHNGARLIAQTVIDRGYKPKFLLDEGLLVVRGILPFVKQDMALVGTSEKGFVTIELKSESPGGHSSMPPRSGSNIGRISRALDRLETNPFPQSLQFLGELFRLIVSELDLLPKIALSNTWLLSPIILRAMANSPSSNAQTRTTTALTVFNAGYKENVLPNVATAKVNFRILPSESVSYVEQKVREIINDDKVTVTAKDGLEPSPVTSTETIEFRTLHKSILEVFPGSFVAPGLMIANTDTRHYWNVTDNIFRFNPLVATAEDLGRIHGINERISVDGLAKVISFYRVFILNSDKN